MDGGDDSASSPDGDYDPSVVDVADNGVTARARETSQITSLLARGRTTRSAAALALRGQLDRLSTFGVQDKEGGEGAFRLGRRKRKFNTQSRPPVRPVDSLSPNEESDESTEGENVMLSDPAVGTSSGALEVVSPTTSSGSSDPEAAGDGKAETNLQDLRREQRGGETLGVNAPTVDTLSKRSHRSQLARKLRNLRPTAKTRRRSSTGTDQTHPRAGRRDSASSRSPLSPSSARSESSYVASEKDNGQRGKNPLASTMGALPTGTRQSMSLIQRKNRRGETRDPMRSTSKEASPGACLSSAPSINASSGGRTSSVPDGWMPPFQRFRRWCGRRNNRDRGTAAISGTGRPAVGTMENIMYSCFGGVAEKILPGTRLSVRQVVDVNDEKKVCRMRVDKPHVVMDRLSYPQGSFGLVWMAVLIDEGCFRDRRRPS